MTWQDSESDVDTTPIVLQVCCTLCKEVKPIHTIAEALADYKDNGDGTYSHVHQQECVACLEAAERELGEGRSPEQIIEDWHAAVNAELDALLLVAPACYAKLPLFLEIDQRQIQPDRYTNGDTFMPRGCMYGATNDFNEFQAHEVDQRVLAKLWALEEEPEEPLSDEALFVDLQMYLFLAMTPINEICCGLYPLEAFESEDKDPDYEGVTREMLFAWITEHYQQHAEVFSQQRSFYAL